jgi:tRNA-dihydrouridine synthase B
LRNPVVLSPMVGVADLPFRTLAWELGAGLVVAEMTSAREDLWSSATSARRRQAVPGAPHVVQIAGADAPMVAAAARREANAGAEIIDINMGCPAKNVCRRAAGSALLKDEGLVADILVAAVNAVDVPVTVKIRTGWSPEHRNGIRIAKIAEGAGVAAIAVHGRTRACRFNGAAEYDTIAAIKAAVSIPVFANGDIDSPEAAAAVLGYTGADGVYIGRAALGAPWLLGEVAAHLDGKVAARRSAREILTLINRHLAAMHEFYGEDLGVRVARKHVKRYLQTLHETAAARTFVRLPDAAAQRGYLLELAAAEIPANVCVRRAA